MIHPRTFFSTPLETLKGAVAGIEQELVERIEHFRSRGQFVEAERVEERTLYDLEMLREFGYLPGHRELFPPPDRTEARASPLTRSSIISRPTS